MRPHHANDVLLRAEVARDVANVVALGAQLPAAASSLSGRRAATVSPYPSDPSRSAIARPIPLEAPVTMAARAVMGRDGRSLGWRCHSAPEPSGADAPPDANRADAVCSLSR